MSKVIAYNCDFCGIENLGEEDVQQVLKKFHACNSCSEGLSFVFSRIAQYTKTSKIGKLNEKKANEMFVYLKKESDNQL